jgi:hypothetical protein
MSWFEKHINLSVLIAVLIAWFTGIAVIFINPNALFYWFIAANFCLALVAVWAIKEKNRSLWWILLIFIFWPTILILGNHSTNSTSDGNNIG